MSDDWKFVMRSDQSSFTLFPTSGWVYVWRTPKQVNNLECLIPTVKHGGRSVMIWAAISWYSAGRVITMNGRITASDYVDILGSQVHPAVQMLFPNNDAIFEIIRQNTQPEMFSPSLRSMTIHFNIFPGQHNHHT